MSFLIMDFHAKLIVLQEFSHRRLFYIEIFVLKDYFIYAHNFRIYENFK